MSWTNAMVAAVLLRFLDPYTAVEQTDDARIGASWASDPNRFPVPMGLVEPIGAEPRAPLPLRAAGKLVPEVSRKWYSEHWPEPRIVHARFMTFEEPPPEYDPEIPSPLFKVNQVGYLPWAPKYAYLGGWLGPELGPWTPHARLSGWQLVDAATGDVVKDSPEPPRFRVPDGMTENGVPFTGEETYEMDFSEVVHEGEYFLRVPGVGRSRSFRIRRGAAEDAFRVHMGGLYQKRCGIAKEEPYTHWTAGACHTEVIRGTFAPDEGKLSSKVRWFDIIRHNTDWAHGERIHMPGGWHDAADYDRRPQHLQIVNDLCAVYLMRPRNFRDGQLAIPENSNGIPDILDEAEWGLRHLLAGQQEDGGVGTWVETTSHPNCVDNVAERDRAQYVLSRATRRSSLMYAANAALLVRCDARFRDKYLDSAIRAWDFALREKPVTVLYEINHTDWPGIHSKEMVYWDEDPELPAEYLVKAGVNLHALTGESRFLESLEADLPRLVEEQGKKGFSWKALTFSGELAAGTPPVMEEFFSGWKKRVKDTAEEILRQMASNYAYRAPWWAPGQGWCHAMSFGMCHPLLRAQWLVAADALFTDPRYLDAASIANDFHNGCNPQGTTLTSGLGDVYPVAFLDLPSYTDGIAEYVPGITPYRWTYALSWKTVQRVFRNNKTLASSWPIWRRWENMEHQTVKASEYTVADTIRPAASVTAYLTEPTGTPPPVRKAPTTSLRDLEGYWLLP